MRNFSSAHDNNPRLVYSTNHDASEEGFVPRVYCSLVESNKARRTSNLQRHDDDSRRNRTENQQVGEVYLDVLEHAKNVAETNDAMSARMDYRTVATHYGCAYTNDG